MSLTQFDSTVSCIEKLWSKDISKMSKPALMNT